MGLRGLRPPYKGVAAPLKRGHDSLTIPTWLNFCCKRVVTPYNPKLVQVAARFARRWGLEVAPGEAIWLPGKGAAGEGALSGVHPTPYTLDPEP